MSELGEPRPMIVIQPMSKCPWRSPAIPREPSVLAGNEPRAPLEAFGECLRDGCALWKPYPIQLMTSKGPMALTGLCSFRFLAEAADPLAGAIQQLASLAMKLATKFGVSMEEGSGAGKPPGPPS